MFVLDPYEVHSVEMWPFWSLDAAGVTAGDAKEALERAEWTLYENCVRNSRFGAVLNEGEIQVRERIDLPESYRHIIAPEGWQERNEHPDVRISRRALTIWQLSKIASERKVSQGLRRTLVVQAQRLLYLAGERYREFGGDDVHLEFGMTLPVEGLPDSAVDDINGDG